VIRRYALPLSLALAIAACGDDSESSPEPDVTEDVTEDVGAEDTAEPDLGTPDTGTPDTGPADPPTITRVSPNQGPIEGQQEVTVGGTNFSSPCDVFYGDTEALASRVVNPGTISTTTPAAETAGQVDVRVVCRNGEVTLPSAYEFVAEDDTLIESVDPDVGLTAGGETITIRGRQFIEGDRNLIALGGTPVEDVVFVDENTITCTTPFSSPGLVGLTLDLGGEITVFPEAFTYLEPLTLSSVDPMTGAVAGGETVNLNGTGLSELAELGVFIGETQVDESTFVYTEDALSISFTTPELEAGTYTIRVTWQLGEATLDDAFTVE